MEAQKQAELQELQEKQELEAMERNKIKVIVKVRPLLNTEHNRMHLLKVEVFW